MIQKKSKKKWKVEEEEVRTITSNQYTKKQSLVMNSSPPCIHTYHKDKYSNKQTNKSERQKKVELLSDLIQEK